MNSKKSKRPGRPKRPGLNVGATADPFEFLRRLMADEGAETRLRVRAAIQLLRLDDEPDAPSPRPGKKQARQAAADAAARGRFRPGTVPPLALVRMAPNDA